MKNFYLRNIRISNSDAKIEFLSKDLIFDVDKLSGPNTIVLTLSKEDGDVIYDKFSIGGMFITPVVNHVSFSPSVIAKKDWTPLNRNLDIYSPVYKTCAFQQSIIHMVSLSNGEYEMTISYNDLYVSREPSIGTSPRPEPMEEKEGGELKSEPVAKEVYVRDFRSPGVYTTEVDTSTMEVGSRGASLWYSSPMSELTKAEREDRARRKAECAPPKPRVMGKSVKPKTLHTMFKPVKRFR